jgi:hypothetical protein
MTECVEEQCTGHYRGRWHGFGPVHNHERVLLAVFETTKRDGFRLTGDSFNNKHLASSSESLVRISYVTKALFDSEIVSRALPQKGALVGVACAKASEIRRLHADIKVSHGIRKVRAICVLDRVDEGDLDGHATMLRRIDAD